MSLYNFSVAPGENSQIPNVCASGYVKNNSSTAIATFVIYSERNATLNKTLSPQQAFNFTNLYILRILNTSADSSCILDVIFSDTSAFSATESESVIQLGSLGSSLGNIPISIDAANITGNIPIEIVANSLGNIPITIAASTITSLPIEIVANSLTSLPIQIVSLGSTLGNIPIEIAANSIGNIPIEIAANSLGNIPITIAASTITSLPIEIVANSLTSLPIQIVSLGSSLGNIPIEIAANNIGNIPIEIAANSLGNIPITLAANTVGNLTIDIAAQTVGNLDTDVGGYSTDLQENQSNGYNILTYNPWKFSTSVNPTIWDASANGSNYAIVQQNGASGYLTFYFNVYNATSSSGSANITVNLYDNLPDNGYSTAPINQFTFSTGTLAAGAQAWITVNPNIFWKYNTMVVIASAQVGQTGGAIGVTVPNTYNNIDTHYWNGTYWNSNDRGFIAFWTITNTAPASLPVAVTNPVRVSEGTPQKILSTSTTSPQLIGTVPNGKKWKILRVYAVIEAYVAGTLQLAVQIVPNSYSIEDLLPLENLAYINISSASINTPYYGYGSIIGAANLQFAVPTQAQMWSDYPILYAGDRIYMIENNITSLVVKVWYVESDI